MTAGRPADIAVLLDELDDVLFVIWDYPELSQTFIHREFTEMERLGARVQLLAHQRLERPDLDEVTRSIADRALFIGPASRWTPRGLAWAARHPVRFGRAVASLASRRHRTLWRRGRAFALTLMAASVADQVLARGYRYLHAHFLSYHLELTMALAALTGLPFGATGHATGIYKDRNILRDKVADSRVVLSCTQRNVDHLRELAGEHAPRVRLVYHGLDFTRLGDPPPLPDGATTRWLAVGRLVPKKGFDDLLHALNRLVEQGADVHLAIVGDGPERDALQALLDELGLADRVELAGTVPNKEVFERLASSHGLVAPSVQAKDGDIDGIPNVILEAMAFGRPVVASDISGIPEVVRTDETGMLVPPGRPAELASAMATVGADHEAAARMGRAARELVLERFDLRRNVLAQLELIARAKQGPVVD